MFLRQLVLLVSTFFAWMQLFDYAIILLYAFNLLFYVHTNLFSFFFFVQKQVFLLLLPAYDCFTFSTVSTLSTSPIVIINNMINSAHSFTTSLQWWLTVLLFIIREQSRSSSRLWVANKHTVALLLLHGRVLSIGFSEEIRLNNKNYNTKVTMKKVTPKKKRNETVPHCFALYFITHS